MRRDGWLQGREGFGALNRMLYTFSTVKDDISVYNENSISLPD